MFNSGAIMDIGVKTYPQNWRYVSRLSRYCDFFEIMAVPDKDYSIFNDIDKPFTIHAIHSHWGVNLADPKKRKINLLAVKSADKAARALGADTIVIHPGHIENGMCSEAHSVRFLKKLDSRFIVENMPQLKGGKAHVGSSFDELQRILDETGKRFCLDFAHASEYAYAHDMDYARFVKRLMLLKPKYFHVSDTRIGQGVDMHLHLGDGNLKLGYFLSLVPKRCQMVIENSHDFHKKLKDIEILRNSH